MTEENVNNDYSTTEILTGAKWINDEPIYKKVITFYSVNAFSYNIPDLDVIVNMKILLKTADNQWRTIPWLYNSGNTLPQSWAGGYYIRTNTGEVIFQLGNDLGNIDYGHFIIEYTKTNNI